jgi:hypothetical protein
LGLRYGKFVNPNPFGLPEEACLCAYPVGDTKDSETTRVI